MRNAHEHLRDVLILQLLTPADERPFIGLCRRWREKHSEEKKPTGPRLYSPSFDGVLMMLLRPIALSLVLVQSPAPDPRPLPDRTTFLIEFQVKRPGLYKLMGAMNDTNLESQYTYTETTIEASLDSKGKTKSSKRQVVDHIPTHVPGYIYERQIVKDGVPLSQKELEKQDKEHEEDLAKVEAARKRWRDDAPKNNEKSSRRISRKISATSNSRVKNAGPVNKRSGRNSRRCCRAQRSRNPGWRTVRCSGLPTFN